MATIRQKIATRKLLDLLGEEKNKKNISMRQILKAAGYSDSVAKNPKTVMQGKGWQELMAEYLPDKLVLKTHKDLIKSTIISRVKFPYETTNEEIRDAFKGMPGFKLLTIVTTEPYTTEKVFIEGKKTAIYRQPENMSRAKALDMVYKLTGRYAPEKVEVFNQYAEMDDSELDREIEEAEKDFNYIQELEDNEPGDPEKTQGGETEAAKE